MEAIAIKSEAYQGNDTYIESMSYDLDELKIIVVADSNKRIQVIFYQPIGFRCLDEGDLLEFWENPEITNNWLLNIKDSGWYEQESKRKGFTSKGTELNEYLVTGQNDCISVFDTNQPKVTLL
jgi:hypothetical protein